MRKGTAHPNCRLTEAQVLEIRRLGKAGMTPTEIARKFNISRAHAYQVCRGTAWSHLAEDGSRS